MPSYVVVFFPVRLALNVESSCLLLKSARSANSYHYSWLKISYLAGHQWLMTFILATQEARAQQDHGSKPARANSLRDPISKKPHHKTHTHTQRD
jgi:hypothetical protein